MHRWLQTQLIARRDQPLDVHGRQKTECKNKKTKMENPNTDTENIQTIYRIIIWHKEMHYAIKEKRETNHDGGSRTTKSRKNQNAQRKRNL